MVFLHSYFYFHCLKLLFNVSLVRVHKYGQVRKQGSKSVAFCFGFYSTRVVSHDFLGVQPNIQSGM